MGNTTSVKAHQHGDVSCTMKHGRRKFRHKRSNRHKRGGSPPKVQSPLNPNPVHNRPTSSATRKKRRSKKKEMPLVRSLLIGNMHGRIVADAKAKASAEEAEEAAREKRFKQLSASMEALAKEEDKQARMKAAVKAAASRKAGTLQGK